MKFTADDVIEAAQRVVGQRGTSVTGGFREALVVRPGDTLIVRYSQWLGSADREHVKAMLEGELPDVKVAVVMADEIAVIRRDGAE